MVEVQVRGTPLPTSPLGEKEGQVELSLPDDKGTGREPQGSCRSHYTAAAPARAVSLCVSLACADVCPASLPQVEFLRPLNPLPLSH